METVDHNRDRFGEGGMLSQFKELRTPSNRKRVALGVAIFIFMQFCGSNAINYYRSVYTPLVRNFHANVLSSPRIFKSVGLTGSSTSLYATGIYGIVRLVCVIIAMHFVVDRFGRKKMLMGGAVVMLIAMVSVHDLEHFNPLDLLLTCDFLSGTLAPTSRSQTQLLPAASPQEDTLPSPSYTCSQSDFVSASLAFHSSFAARSIPCTFVASEWYVSEYFDSFPPKRFRNTR
jgi:MFS family permease